LPRLDVAAFVGFAERGPVDLPVAVEDKATFEAIFGHDLALAQAPDGEIVYANLPRAVEAFFDQGGRRCYVVRVVGVHAATATLPLPGVAGVDGDGNVTRPTLAATSPGAWANRLRLSLRLVSKPLPPTAFHFQPDGAVSWRTGGAPQAIQPGELLRFSSSDGTSRLVAVQSVALVSPLEGTLTVGGSWAELRTAPSSPPTLVAAFLPGAAAPLPIPGQPLSATRGMPAISVTRELAATLSVGDTLELSLSDGEDYLFGIESIVPEQPAGPLPAGSTTLSTRALIQKRFSPSVVASPPLDVSRVERLRFDMAVRLGERTLIVEDMGFNPEHPRFWADVCLQESSVLRTRVGGYEALQEAELIAPGNVAAQNAALFRVLQTGRRIEPARDGHIAPTALAGLVASVEPIGGTAFLPAGMRGWLEPDLMARPLTLGWDDLDRYDANSSLPFQDTYITRFNDGSASALSADAFDRYYVQEQRLRGLHSLFFVDEAALISVTDGNHRNWSPGRRGVPSGPVEDLPDQPEPPADLLSVCIGPPWIDAIDPSRSSAAGGAIVDITGQGFVAGDTTILFGGRPSSDVNVIDGSHLRCVVPPSTAGPTNVVVVTEGGRSAPARFLFTEAPTPSTVGALDDVEAFSLDTSPLLAIQRALITFCAARSDMTAILSLPQHFQKRQVLEWRQKLPATADLSFAAVYHPWLFLRDSGSAKPALRLLPPDGAVCGLIARREHERQVWGAPANEPLANVLGLSPDLSDDDWAELFDAQVNLVRPQPRDFRPMSAHTLSSEQSLLQLSTRRLLILLRKLLLQRGAAFVFESNHERFRTLTRIALEGTLRSMFDRGAFAGRTAAESFRVVADDSVNPRQSVDLGRFVVQVQVAPSQPMEFITVQLTRTGSGELLAAEA
jgi:hypothetical protein